MKTIINHTTPQKTEVPIAPNYIFDIVKWVPLNASATELTSRCMDIKRGIKNSII